MLFYFPQDVYRDLKQPYVSNCPGFLLFVFLNSHLRIIFSIDYWRSGGGETHPLGAPCTSSEPRRAAELGILPPGLVPLTGSQTRHPSMPGLVL